MKLNFNIRAGRLVASCCLKNCRKPHFMRKLRKFIFARERNLYLHPLLNQYITGTP
jgi:hypothetical protein